jgi:hypothetical protein
LKGSNFGKALVRKDPSIWHPAAGPLDTFGAAYVTGNRTTSVTLVCAAATIETALATAICAT